MLVGGTNKQLVKKLQMSIVSNIFSERLNSFLRLMKNLFLNRHMFGNSHRPCSIKIIKLLFRVVFRTCWC